MSPREDDPQQAPRGKVAPDVGAKTECLATSVVPEANEAADIPVPHVGSNEELIVEHEESEPMPGKHEVMDVSIDVRKDDISNTVTHSSLGEYLKAVSTWSQKTKLRRLEISCCTLSPEDKAKFEVAMKIDSKVTSLCQTRGIPRERRVRARQVLV